MATGTVDPRTLPNYFQYERQFQNIFGAQEDFSRFLSDPRYRDELQGRVFDQRSGPLGGLPSTRDLQKSQFLGDPGFQSFLNSIAAGQSFQDIDVAKLYDPLKGEVNQMSEASRMSQRQQIGAAARGAEEQATEALAGTGLGRSGVAANQFGEIGQRKQDLLQRAEGEIEQRRLQALFDISLKQANMEYAEQLRAAGFSQQMVQDALNFDRMLYQMQFGAELQAELNEEGGNWFTDLVNLGASVVPIIGGIKGL